MTFNHYAKLKRIIAEQPAGWFIRRIEEPTSAKNFKGEVVRYDHCYRLYASDGSSIQFGKFQKLDKLADVLGIPVEALPLAS